MKAARAPAGSNIGPRRVPAALAASPCAIRSTSRSSRGSNGHALGGGMEMMLGCDIVVAFRQCDLRPARAARRPAWRSTAALRCWRAASPCPGDGPCCSPGVASKQTRRCALASSMKWFRRLNSTPRSRAGSPIFSPARRCRCARSSRWCGPGEFVGQASADAAAGPALVDALKSSDSGRGRARLPGEARAAMARKLRGGHGLCHRLDLHRREGRRLPGTSPGRMHL